MSVVDQATKHNYININTHSRTNTHYYVPTILTYTTTTYLILKILLDSFYSFSEENCDSQQGFISKPWPKKQFLDSLIPQ